MCIKNYIGYQHYNYIKGICYNCYESLELNHAINEYVIYYHVQNEGFSMGFPENNLEEFRKYFKSLKQIRIEKLNYLEKL